MLNLNQEFRTKSEIRQLANSIFTTQGAPGTSDKYAHISTEKNHRRHAVVRLGSS